MPALLGIWLKRTELSSAASPVSAPAAAKTAHFTRGGVEAGEARGVRIRSGRVDRAAGGECRSAPRRAPPAAPTADGARDERDTPPATSPSHWKPARQVLHPRALRRPAQRVAQRHHRRQRDDDRRACRTYATSAPLSAPSAAPARQATSAHGRHRQRRPWPSDAGDHAADGEHRSDGDVDFAGEDDQRGPERDDQHRQVGEEQVAEVLAREVAGRGEREQRGEAPRSRPRPRPRGDSGGVDGGAMAAAVRVGSRVGPGPQPTTGAWSP